MSPPIPSLDHIKRWYASAHFRKKCDWLCVHQPKVIHEWVHHSRVIVLVGLEDALPKFESSCNTQIISKEWLSDLAESPGDSGCILVLRRESAPIVNLETSKNIVMLDGVQDPGNMGTIIRSMIAFGITTLCVTNDCVDVAHPKAMSASVGLGLRMNVFKEDQWLSWFNQMELPVIVLAGNANQTIESLQLTQSYVLVFGSEGHGVTHPIFTNKKAQYIKIPMASDVESLNVGVAVSIVLAMVPRLTIGND